MLRVQVSGPESCAHSAELLCNVSHEDSSSEKSSFGTGVWNLLPSLLFKLHTAGGKDGVLFIHREISCDFSPNIPYFVSYGFIVIIATL